MLESSAIIKLLKFRPSSFQQPNGWVGHMPFAYCLVDTHRPRTIVELGTHTGNSYFSFCQSILENKTGSQAFAVDTWQGDSQSGYYDESVFQAVELTNQKYESFSKLLRMSFDEAAKHFDDESIDLLHIDGLHTYQAVRNDFETWLPKMSKKGIVLFHDTNVHADGFGVHRFWEELTKKYNTLEFFHAYGLGILEVSDHSNLVIPGSDEKKNQMREIFSVLSEQLLMRFERDSILSERGAGQTRGRWVVARLVQRILQSMLRSSSKKT